MIAGAGVEPGKGGVREGCLQSVTVVADFDHQQAAWIQVFANLLEHAAYQIKTVFAAGQRELRFVPVFFRQGRHRFGIDVGRIGNDYVVALFAERCKQIGLDEAQARLQPVVAYVSFSHGQCVG